MIFGCLYFVRVFKLFADFGVWRVNCCILINAAAKSNLAEARRKVVNALGWIIVDDQDAQLPAPVADVEEGVNTWLNLPHNASMVLDAYAKVGAQPPPPAPPVQAPPRPPAQAPARPYLADPFDIPYHPADLLFHPPLPQAPQQRPPTQQSPAPPPPEVRNEPSSSRTRRRPRGNDDEASSSSSRQRRGGD